MPQPSRAKPPDPPDLPEDLEALDGEFASAADPVVGALLRDLSLPSRKSIGLRLRECRLERTTLRDSDLSSSVWRDVALRDCDLAGVRLEAAEWHRAEVAGGRLTGVTGPQMKLCQVSIQDSRIDYASFRFSELKCVRFADCDLTEADFQGAKLADVAFENCRLRATDFSKVQLQRVDFSESELDAIVIGAQELSGAIVNPTQAARLAELFGLTVRWEG